MQDVDEVEVALRNEVQAQGLDSRQDHLGPPDEYRPRQPLGDDLLHRLEHPPFLPFPVDDALACAACALEQRLHHEPRPEHEPGQALPIGVEVVDGTGGDARVHRGVRHRGGDLGEQPGVERARDQHVGTEPGLPAAVRLGHQIGRLPAGQPGQRVDAGELHRLVDVGRSRVERPAEDERKAQDVVDLVRIVGPAGGDDRVTARLAGGLGKDLGHRVREREDERILRHARDVVGFEHVGGRKAEKDVGAADDVGEGACVGIDRVARLPPVHQLLAARVHHARDVGDDDVLARKPHAEQQIEAGERRGAGTRRDEPDLPDGLADEFQRVAHRRADDDRGAVLIVVEHRDVHPLAQPRFDLEALRRLDVLEVDSAERGLEARDDVAEAVRVGLVDLDVEHVDAGELLEQHRLAFHDGLRRQRPDGAEAEHRGPVGHHRDEIRACGQARHLGRVDDDRVAGGGDARGVGEREVVLARQRLGGADRELSRHREAVVREGVV